MRFLIFPLVFLLSSAVVFKYVGPNKGLPQHFNFITFWSQGQHLQMAYQYQKAVQPINQTIVLLHGKNFSSDYWQATMNHLTDEGYDVLAIDQVGFGRSSQPLFYQFTFQQLATNTKLLLDSLHISKATFLGHSMGGMLAVRFALMFPEKCNALILENPIGLEDWKISLPYASVDAETKKELNKTSKDLKEYMFKNYFHETWKPEYDLLLIENERLIADKRFALYAKNMALTSDMIFTQPVCYEFKNIKVPVTLIIGQADRMAMGKDHTGGDTSASLGNYSKLGRKVLEVIPNARLIELPGLGHIPHIENFHVFISNLDYTLKSNN